MPEMNPSPKELLLDLIAQIHEMWKRDKGDSGALEQDFESINDVATEMEEQVKGHTESYKKYIEKDKQWFDGVNWHNSDALDI